MSSDPISRTIAITIKAGKGGLTPAESKSLAKRIADIVGDAGYAVHVQEVVGGGELYVGTRPTKRDRIMAIQALPEKMTASEIAASLGLTERQVYRYRALLKKLGSDS